MACAKCHVYLPKESASTLFLEGKQHLLRLLQDIPLGEAEQAAVAEGITAYERLLANLVDVPTPSGKTPREIGGGMAPITALTQAVPTVTGVFRTRLTGTHENRRISYAMRVNIFPRWGILALRRAYMFRGLKFILTDDRTLLRAARQLDSVSSAL